MKKMYWVFLFFICYIQCDFATTATKDKLAHINTSINTLRKTIILTEAQKEKIQQQLENTEQNIGETKKKLRITNAHLQKQTHVLRQIQSQHAHYEDSLSEQGILLEQHIRAAYMLGRQQYLKMIFNQENPADISRHIAYYRYLTKARIHVMNKAHTTLVKLQKVTLQLNLETARLRNIKQEQQHENNQLLLAHTKRQHLLNTLDASINNKQQQLERLLKDKENLENVLKHVQSKSILFPPSGADFIKTKGLLPWPVKGSIIQAYQQPIADGRLRSTGILIKSPEGTPVHAVFNGKVVFAHWLRGFGLLTIVQHGRNYMTLYAHAESLYVKVGDQVKTGDLIATIGNSGGFQQSALYFEIRHKDQPVNPMYWLKKG